MSSTNVYVLTFVATGVSPSAGPSERHNAFSLRCLSTVLGMWRKGYIKVNV